MGMLSKMAAHFRQESSDRPYECLHCGIHLDVEYYTCPDCGSFSIDRRSLHL